MDSAGYFYYGQPTIRPITQSGRSPTNASNLTKGFWIGKTMVTIGQWRSVTGRPLDLQISEGVGVCESLKSTATVYR